MNVQDIKTPNDFIGFLSKHSDFVHESHKEYPKSICGTALKSEVLYILPATTDLNNIENYDHLKFVTINNFLIDKKGFEILEKNKDRFKNVQFLNLWNIKQKDLELLKLFPNVKHLLISHIGKTNFPFKGLDHLITIETLILISANKISDFNFLSKDQKKPIKHLYITYSKNLTKLDGIEDFHNLQTLSLFASTAESKKAVTLDNLNGIENLSNLQYFEIDYFRFDLKAMQIKLKCLKKLKEYKIGKDVYKNEY